MRIIALIALSMLLTIVTAVVGTFFFYASWNWGMVPAVTFAKPVDLIQAFWLSLSVASTAALCKTGLSLKE